MLIVMAWFQVLLGLLTLENQKSFRLLSYQGTGS